MTTNINPATLQIRGNTTAGHIPTTTQLSAGEPAFNSTDGRFFIKRTVNSTDYMQESAMRLPQLKGSITGTGTVVLTMDSTGTVLTGGTNSIPILPGFAGRIIGTIIIKNTGNADVIVYDFDLVANRNGSGNITIGNGSPSITAMDYIGSTFGTTVAPYTVSYPVPSLLVDNNNYSINVSISGIASTTLSATALDISNFTY